MFKKVKQYCISLLKKSIVYSTVYLSKKKNVVYSTVYLSQKRIFYTCNTVYLSQKRILYIQYTNTVLYISPKKNIADISRLPQIVDYCYQGLSTWLYIVIYTVQ